jgi:hypothetical protein
VRHRQLSWHSPVRDHDFERTEFGPPHPTPSDKGKSRGWSVLMNVKRCKINGCGVLKAGYCSDIFTEGLQKKRQENSGQLHHRRKFVRLGYKGLLEQDTHALATVRRNVLSFFLTTLNLKEGMVGFTRNSQEIKNLVRKPHNLEPTNRKMNHRISQTDNSLTS